MISDNYEQPLPTEEDEQGMVSSKKVQELTLFWKRFSRDDYAGIALFKEFFEMSPSAIA